MAKEVNNKNNRHFFKDFKAELKKVIWPTPKQVVNSTTAVITIVLITALIVFVLDLAFKTGNKYGVNKLKSMVSTENTVENTTQNDLENNTVNENQNDTNVVDNSTDVENQQENNTTNQVEE